MTEALKGGRGEAGMNVITNWSFWSKNKKEYILVTQLLDGDSAISFFDLIT